MVAVQYLSKSAFAAHRGVSPGYVTKLKDQGRLVMAPDGKRVDVAATEQLLSATADPAKAPVAERHQRERVERGVHMQLAPSAPELPPLNEHPDYQQARAHREHYLSELAKDELLKGRGALVARDSVDHAAFSAARTLRDLLLGLPAQIAGELIAIADPWEMERRLTAHLRRALEDAASLNDHERGLGNPASDDLEQKLDDYRADDQRRALVGVLLRQPLNQLLLGSRAARALGDMGVSTIGDLAKLSEPDLLDSPDLGHESIRDIKVAMSEYGIALKTE